MWDVLGTLHKFKSTTAVAGLALLLGGCFNTNDVTWTKIDGGPSTPKGVSAFGGNISDVTIGNSGYLPPASSGGGGFAIQNTISDGFSNSGAGNTGSSAGFKMTGNVYVGN